MKLQSLSPVNVTLKVQNEIFGKEVIAWRRVLHSKKYQDTEVKKNTFSDGNSSVQQTDVKVSRDKDAELRLVGLVTARIAGGIKERKQQRQI